MTVASAGPESARDRLLREVMVYARTHGLGEVSLRALAAAVGTSHRMLLYHFGSREGLVAAVVAKVEEQQREVMRALSSAWATDPVAANRQFWAGLTDPRQHENERLFFEAVALALRGRPGTGSLRETLVEPWLAAFVDAGRGLGIDEADVRLDARVGMALARGLLLDLLVTGDKDGVDAAMERFLGRYLR
jgi:AcrR family transcriptional regulator